MHLENLSITFTARVEVSDCKQEVPQPKDVHSCETITIAEVDLTHGVKSDLKEVGVIAITVKVEENEASAI